MKNHISVIAGALSFGRLTALSIVVGLAVVPTSSVYSARKKPAVVRLTSEDVTLRITFDSGKTITVTSKGTKLKAGTHFVKSLSLFKKDKKGRVWKLRCAKRLSTLGTITLTPGQEKIIDTGRRPIHFDYVIWARNEDKGIKVLFRVTAQGGYGEAYYPGAILGRKVPPMPAYHVTDEKGKVLASGRLKHLANDTGIYDWVVPEGLTGNCKIEIKPVMGPFKWKPPSKQFNPKPRQ